VTLRVATGLLTRNAETATAGHEGELVHASQKRPAVPAKGIAEAGRYREVAAQNATEDIHASLL